MQGAARAETERGEQADDSRYHRPQHRRLGAREVKLLGSGSHDDLKQRYGGGERGYDKQHKEYQAEEVAARHLLEDHRQRGEDQRRTGFGLDAEREGSGEDYDAGEDGHQRVGQNDAHRTADHVVFGAYVGAIGDECAHANREREEALAQGTDEHMAVNLREIGLEEEAQALGGAGERE